MTSVVILIAFLTFGLVVSLRQHHRNVLTRLRAEWGRDVARTRTVGPFQETHQARLGATGDVAVVDERTSHDLHLDDVFARLDRTQSTLGQHALYHRLRCHHSVDDLKFFDALVTRFELDQATREHAQTALARLQDLNGYNLWWLKQPDALNAPAWYAAFPLLTAVALAVAVFVPVAGFAPIFAVPFALNVVIGLVVSTRLSQMAAAFRQLAPLISVAQQLRHLDIDHPTIIAIKQSVRRLSSLKTLSRWISNNALMLTTDAPFLLTVVNDVANIVYGYLNLALLLDGTVIWFGTQRLRDRANDLLQTLVAMGDIDAAISVASFRAGTDRWARPTFGTGALTLSEVRHPLIANAVQNSVALPAGHGVLVTGANMAGKSTFLRTVGVSAVLAQTVYTCLASAYEGPVLIVRSFIGRTDDLLAGKSYYLAEVEALLELVKQSHSASPHLFLLDELFRGTNAVERIAAGEAVLEELLADRKSHIVIAATHDAELADLISANYSSFHFADAIGPQGLWFDYRLRAGATMSRNALTLLEMQGAPEALVERAKRRATLLEKVRPTPT